MLGAIKVTIKALVIFRKSLKNIRTKIAIRMLAPFRKHVQTWVKNRREQFREVLISKCEQLEMGNLLFRAIAAWKLHVISMQVMKIQRNIRKFLAVQKARKLVLMRLWDLESELLYVNLYPQPRRRSSMILNKKQMLNQEVFLPDIYKERYIQSYIRFKFKELVLKYFEYDHVCKEVRVKFQKNYRYLRISALAEGRDADIKPEYPAKPSLSLYRDKMSLHKIIKEAFMRKISESRRMSLLGHDKHVVVGKNTLSFL